MNRGGFTRTIGSTLTFKDVIHQDNGNIVEKGSVGDDQTGTFHD